MPTPERSGLHTVDHTVRGFNTYSDRYTSMSSPLVEDDKISVELRTAGLNRTDAHHLMLALRGRCDIFLTCDSDFLKKRVLIEGEFQIQVMRPSALATQLA